MVLVLQGKYHINTIFIVKMINVYFCITDLLDELKM